MKQITAIINGELHIRVQKQKAQHLAETLVDEKILVYPNKVCPSNKFIGPYVINEQPIDKEEFYHRSYMFEYYNCNNELGYYCSYYIPYSLYNQKGK